MADIDLLFPTQVYVDKLGLTRDNMISRAYEIRELFPKKNDWYCGTYNSLDSYDLSQDSVFGELINRCQDAVDSFARTYNAIGKAEYLDGWVNIASPGDFQEFHKHSDSHFSLVYYLKTPKGSGRFVLKPHEVDFDMFPLKVSEYNAVNMQSAMYEVEEDMVLIFRSHLQHMVESNKSNEDRISVAMNFRIK